MIAEHSLVMLDVARRPNQTMHASGNKSCGMRHTTRLSSDELIHHVTMYVGQPPVDSVVPNRQLSMINA